MEGYRRGCMDHWDHFGCVSGPFQVTSSPGTKAKTDTSHGLTSQVSACAAGEWTNNMCCHSKAAFSPRLSPPSVCQSVCLSEDRLSLLGLLLFSLRHPSLPLILKAYVFFLCTVQRCIFTSVPRAYINIRYWLDLMNFVCLRVFVCFFVVFLLSSGKRWSSGPRPVHPLSRSLQKLLRPRRVSVPQDPGPALLQVHTHTHTHTVWLHLLAQGTGRDKCYQTNIYQLLHGLQWLYLWQDGLLKCFTGCLWFFFFLFNLHFTWILI